MAQYVAYTPYGETFKEYRNVTPYKFNGKERDDETGYYYYGARYYDPGTVLWLGVDPLAYKYPMNSPYVYCNGNPVIYIDSDGAEGFSVTASARITVGPQMGFDIGNFVKAEVNIGSVDILGVSELVFLSLLRLNYLQKMFLPQRMVKLLQIKVIQV